MKRQRILISILVMGLLLLTLVVGKGLAQEPASEDAVQTQDEVGAAAALSDAIPIQGRLTDAGLNPLDGTYNITFRLYDVASGGTALCEDTDPVAVSDGLFNAEINTCTSDQIDGRQLWLGIQVASDPEMTPRQSIQAAPYAWSLRPGATIQSTQGNAILKISNDGNGPGLQSVSLGGYGVYGQSYATGRAGVIGASFGFVEGIGVVGHSDMGVSVSATGTGVIASSAKSYVWISGNGLRPYRSSDSTIIDMDTTGGAYVYRGTEIGAKDVMVPITVPGPLYGQDVTVSGLDIYYKSNTEFDVISAVILRRQINVGGAGSFANIVYDLRDPGSEYNCLQAGGCTLHYDLTENNVLTADSGILYLTLKLQISSGTSWMRIGGVRLTLEHD